MRKIVLFCLSLAISATLSAQENKDGKMQGETLYLNDGSMLRKGSRLRLNGPLGEDSRFKYVHHAPDNLLGDVTATLDKPAEPYYATREVIVRKIRYVGDKKSSSDGKWIVRFRDNDKKDFLCDIVPALSSGEVSAMHMSVVTPQTPPQQTLPQQATPIQPVAEPTKTAVEPAQPNNAAAPAFSVADELLKLKKLMDEGIITKEEFEAQKKKLLDK